MLRRALPGLALALLLLGGTAAHAAVRSGTIGVAEGDPAEVVCPANAYLAGFAAQWDVVLSGLMPYCVAMAPDGAWQGGAQIHMDIMMSDAIPGGKRLDFFCPRDFYMFAVRGFSHVYGIHSIMVITLTCLNVKTGARTAFGTQPNGASITEWPEVSCPEQTVASGVFGRINSARIIQFGFDCAKTKPAIVLSQMLVPKGSLDKAALITKPQGSFVPKPKSTLDTSTLVVPKGGSIAQDSPSAILQSPDIVATPKPSDTGMVKDNSKLKLGALIQPTQPVPPPDPAPAPVPSTQQYAPPYTKNGARLYACDTVGGNACGQPVAAAFCQQQGFTQAQSFNNATESTSAETLAGQKCTKKKCKVFTQIVCTR